MRLRILCSSTAGLPKGWSLPNWLFPLPEWPRLVVGKEGVSYCLSPSHQVTVLADACVGYFHGGTGRRVAEDADGFQVVVTAEDWVRGERALADMDEVFRDRHPIDA